VDAAASPRRESPEELLDRFRRRGEPDAFGALFDATAPELHRVAVALVKDPAAADDVVQETYLAALRLLPRFERGRAVMPWLVALLQRRLQHARRSERRARARVVAFAGRTETPRGDVVPAAQPESGDRVALHAALEGLEEPYRGVALLRWRYGLLPIDIARVRGEPAGTTRSLLSRAAERLRARFPGSLPAALAVEGGGLGAVRARVVEAASTARPAPPPLASSPAPIAAKVVAGAALLALAVGAGVAALAIDGDVPRADEPAAVSAARGDVVPGLAAAAVARVPSRASDGPVPVAPATDAAAPALTLLWPWDSPADNAALPVERVPLRVTVVDGWGAAVPHAKLRAMWGEWGTGVVVADEGGRVEMRVPRGTRALEVVGAGPEEKRRLLFVHYHPLTGDPAETRVVVRTGAEILGRVVTAGGTPVRGARVRAVPTAFGYGAVSTDADGRFRLSVLEAEAVDVRFDGEYDGDAKPRLESTPPLRGIVRGVVPGRGGDVEVVADSVSWGHEVHVRVTDEDGRAVAGAPVWAEIAGAVGIGVGETDAGGGAVLRGLPRWPCVVRVQAPASAPERRLMDRSLCDVVPGGPPVEVTLVANTPLRGRVVDGEGRPVAKAWCAAFEQGGWYVACFATDEDGRFDSPSNVAAGTRLQVTARFPMEGATSCGVVDGVIAGGGDPTVVIREFRKPDPEPPPVPPAMGEVIIRGAAVIKFR
jgi:RNA polymerase sigma-70 factor, ECF subfamily